MLQEDKKEQINSLLEKSVQEISISESQYETLKENYHAVGEFLMNSPTLKGLKIEIHPQGSIRLGTAIKPIAKEDDIDIDLVCELTNVPDDWTQKKLKEEIGKCFLNSERYRPMIEDPEGGTRCWTLIYSRNTPHQYHMDVLPSIVADDYRMLLEKFDYKDYSRLAICITDKYDRGYKTCTNHAEWPHSNPFGYAKWFESRCRYRTMDFANESVENVPKYEASKSVLKGVIMLLKRHRDLMFAEDKDNKPISIIITTLAAEAYGGESNLYDALVGIVSRMPSYIVNRKDAGKSERWVANPTNPSENFADKWPSEPQKEANFDKWMKAVQEAVAQIQEGEMRAVQSGMESLIGDNISRKVFETMGGEKMLMRMLGKVGVSTTGTLGTAGTKIQAHNFHGK